ncbi:MAG TPA: ABC transporter substrate-binding protein [Clostridiales bacterium]|nr:ABC transporter substrate-binding protein [Clostridiales bacterium]
MKTGKRILCAVLATLTACLTAAGFASCKKRAKYTVGICQLVTHDALDAATEGFMAALTAELGAENVAFDLQNAAGSADTCGTIVNTFVSKRVDLILANATPALLAAANSTADIPILGTSVTDYGKTFGIADFNGIVGGNISGTSDKVQASVQAAAMKELFPDAKTIGLLYCSAEPNSEYQVTEMEPELQALGYTTARYKFSESTELAGIVGRAVAECDALYIPTDNTAASNAETIYGAMGDNKKPIFAGEKGICSGCGVATLSIDYYTLGYETGKMAAEILRGEAKISEMAIRYDTSPKKRYNERICSDLGFTVPDGYEKLD